MIHASGQEVVSAAVSGTFGEILQGYVRGSGGFEHFLFTAPVQELRCRARLRPRSSGDLPPRVLPADRSLALSAFERLAAELGAETAGCVIELESNIPVAKGHASSTADILAAADLCLRRFHPATPEPVARALTLAVARELEFGDYLLHPGIAACHQRTHRLITAFRTDLRWTIVGIDEGGFVRTEEFHRHGAEDPGKASVYERLFAELDRALRADDFAAAAAVATESAELHDDRLPKKSLNALRTVQADTGALGICIAHSGTLSGLIYSRHQEDFRERVAQGQARLAAFGYQSSVYTLKEAASRESKRDVSAGLRQGAEPDRGRG